MLCPMARNKSGAVAVSGRVEAVARLEALGLDPLARLAEILEERVEQPEDEGVLKSMLCTNWEVVPGEPGMLRPNIRLRYDINLELMAYAYAKRKAKEDEGSVDRSIVVNIVNAIPKTV